MRWDKGVVLLIDLTIDLGGGHGELVLFRGLRKELSRVAADSYTGTPLGVWEAESRIGLKIRSFEVVLPAAIPGLAGLVSIRTVPLGVAAPSPKPFRTGSELFTHLSIEYSPSLLYGLEISIELLHGDPVKPTPTLFLRSRLSEARYDASISFFCAKQALQKNP
jgi:hypothetical protein